MRENSKKDADAGRTAKKSGAMIAAIVIIILAMLLIGAFVLTIHGREDAGLNGILGVYIAVLAAVVIGVLFALRQRLHEIKNGEEEEAKKY